MADGILSKLTFYPPDDDTNFMAAQDVISALAGMQRAIYLLAMDVEKVEVRGKDRVDGHLQATYEVRIGPLAEGSLVIPARIGNPSIDLFAPDKIRGVVENFGKALDAIVRNDVRAIGLLVPDRIRRQRFIEAVRGIIPKSGSRTRVRVEVEGVAPIDLTQREQERVRAMLRRSDQAQVSQTITGELIKIDFKDRKLTLRYLPSAREVACTYEEAVEEMLLENPRELIQVTGTVTLGEDGFPDKLSDVERIEEVDYSPITIAEIGVSGQSIRFRPELLVYPELDDTQQLYLATYDGIGLHVFAETREGLLQEIEEQIAMLWTEYAQAADDELSASGRKIKQRLLDAVERATARRGNVRM